MIGRRIAAILLPLAIVSAGGAVAASRQGDDPYAVLEVQRPRVRLPAPAFTLPSLDGGRVRLADFRGKVVLLNFWATWCGPCRIEMPTLQALTEDYKDQPFQVVAVAGDVEGLARVQPFMQGLGLTFPGLIDQDGRIQDIYFVNALPMTYVLDKNGIVVYKMVGFFDWNLPKFRGLIEDLISEA